MGAMYDVILENEKCVEYIQSKLSQEAILIQFAEECNEVAQVALKLVRIYQGENPTPVTAREASEKFHEEVADFFACLVSLTGVDYDKIEDIETKKLNRWAIRLAKRGKR